MNASVDCCLLRSCVNKVSQSKVTKVLRLHMYIYSVLHSAMLCKLFNKNVIIFFHRDCNFSKDNKKNFTGCKHPSSAFTDVMDYKGSQFLFSCTVFLYIWKRP